MKYFWISLYCIIVILPIIFWYQANAAFFSDGNTITIQLYALAKVAGIIAFVMFSMQLVTAARLPFIEKNFGQDKLMRFHRFTGITAFCLLLLHPLLFDAYYLLAAPELWLAFLLPKFDWKTLGSAAFIVMVAVVVLAIWTKRFRLPYHWWKRIHMLSYVGVGAAFLHSWFLGSDIIFNKYLHTYWIILITLGGLAFLYQRIIIPLWVRRFPYTIQNLHTEAEGATSITLQGKILRYLPGQFLFIKFISNVVSGEWHPFTISSSPTETGITITPKELGDWTKTLSNLKVGDTAYIQAPFGRFTFLHVPENRALVFIAGGIGITPFRSMLKYMTDQKIKRNVTLFYSTRTLKDMAFKAELDAFTQVMNLTFIPIISDDPAWTGETKRIDNTLLQKYISDVTTKDWFICGPPPMMHALEKTLQDLGVDKSQIHTEKFSLK